jgi:hypothetical protein
LAATGLVSSSVGGAWELLDCGGDIKQDGFKHVLADGV